MVLFVGYGAISRMEYLNAAEMKKMTDKRNKEINEEIMEKIQTKIFDAAKIGCYNIIVDILPIPVAEELRNMGYEVKCETRGSGIIISWRK